MDRSGASIRTVGWRRREILSDQNPPRKDDRMGHSAGSQEFGLEKGTPVQIVHTPGAPMEGADILGRYGRFVRYILTTQNLAVVEIEDDPCPGTGYVVRSANLVPDGREHLCPDCGDYIDWARRDYGLRGICSDECSEWDVHPERWFQYGPKARCSACGDLELLEDCVECPDCKAILCWCRDEEGLGPYCEDCTRDRDIAAAGARCERERDAEAIRHFDESADVNSHNPDL